MVTNDEQLMFMGLVLPQNSRLIDRLQLSISHQLRISLSTVQFPKGNLLDNTKVSDIQSDLQDHPVSEIEKGVLDSLNYTTLGYRSYCLFQSSLVKTYHGIDFDVLKNQLLSDYDRSDIIPRTCYCTTI